MDVEDKIELLIWHWNTIYILQGQDKIPLNDIEARFYERKESKNFMVAYNIPILQSITITKLICAIKRHTKPFTDHYELKSQKEQYKTYKKYQNT